MQRESIVTDYKSDAVRVTNFFGASPVLFVCEHASNYIPARYNSLGLTDEGLASHVAWDPGALDLAKGLANTLDAPLVAGGISRLIFDCNRPPDAPDAMPAHSEIFAIPGNRDLSPDQRRERVSSVYAPFRQALAKRISAMPRPLALVTIHSFTPVYNGVARATEIGVLHDEDTRLADVLLSHAAEFTQMNVARNEPYGPTQGVTHTLTEHAIQNEMLNVMLEIRNDLLSTPAQTQQMTRLLSDWFFAAFADLGIALDRTAVKCPD